MGFATDAPGGRAPQDPTDAPGGRAPQTPTRTAVLHRQPPAVERELKEAVASPHVIPLSGGVPADELFPGEQMAAAMADVMRADPAGALQYGWPEGSDRLRAHIAGWMAARGAAVAPEAVLVTSGAQQAIHLLARLLVPEGAPLAVETPTYVSALQAFDLRKPRYEPVPRAAAGIDLDALARAFRRGARVLYLVATGHNPTGGVLTVAEQHDVLDLAERYDAWILDDDAYGDIRFEVDAPPLRSHGRHLHRVVHVGSFSKVLAPGLRVGWLAGPRALVREATHVKQAVDLETATLAQRILARWLDRQPLDRHIARCITVYQSRRDSLVSALNHHLPDTSFETPSAGFSLLCRFPGKDVEELLPLALREGVAIEPAAPYFVEAAPPDAGRLSFSNVPERQLEEAVRRLARALTA